MSSGYRVLSASDVKAFPPISWLASYIIPQTALAVLYGPPGVGKSFVALDLAHSIATGIRWMGRRVRQGYVRYVAAGEGVAGLRARLEAWELERDVEIDNVGYMTDAIQLHQTAPVHKLIRSLKDDAPALVVFDTLARCTAGMNENSVEDMGKAISAADEIRAQTGAAVLFVHHTGREDEDGQAHERGSSALPAAVDTLIEMTKLEGTDARLLRCRKQKDAEPFAPIRCRLRAIRRAGRTLSLVPVAASGESSGSAPADTVH